MSSEVSFAFAAAQLLCTTIIQRPSLGFDLLGVDPRQYAPVDLLIMCQKLLAKSPSSLFPPPLANRVNVEPNVTHVSLRTIDAAKGVVAKQEKKEILQNDSRHVSFAKKLLEQTHELSEDNQPKPKAIEENDNSFMLFDMEI